MKESIWGYAILTLGILALGVIWFFANTTRTDQHNYALLKETTEAAMMDAVDLAYYRQTGKVRIEEEKFVENFIRRFAENADLSNAYKIEIYDVNEEPPKVSLKVSSGSKTNATGEIIEFNIVNNIDAILETKYYLEEEEIENSDTENQGEKCSLEVVTINIVPDCRYEINNKYFCEYDISNVLINSEEKYIELEKVTANLDGKPAKLISDNLDKVKNKYTIEIKGFLPNIAQFLNAFTSSNTELTVNYKLCY